MTKDFDEERHYARLLMAYAILYKRSIVVAIAHGDTILPSTTVQINRAGNSSEYILSEYSFSGVFQLVNVPEEEIRIKSDALGINLDDFSTHGQWVEINQKWKSYLADRCFAFSTDKDEVWIREECGGKKTDLGEVLTLMGFVRNKSAFDNIDYFNQFER